MKPIIVMKPIRRIEIPKLHPTAALTVKRGSVLHFSAL
jgi:hypothetical protein